MKALYYWPVWGESTMTGGFPSHMASNAESFSTSRWNNAMLYEIRQWEMTVKLGHIPLTCVCIYSTLNPQNPSHQCSSNMVLNSLAPIRSGCNLRLKIFKLISRIHTFGIFCEIALRWCYKTSLVNGQYWFRQQAITSNYADQVLWCHVASLDHNERT